MTRMLFPALILTGPAAAHTDPHVHVHGTDYAMLGAGLALAALAVTVLISKLPK